MFLLLLLSSDQSFQNIITLFLSGAYWDCKSMLYLFWYFLTQKTVWSLVSLSVSQKFLIFLASKGNATDTPLPSIFSKKQGGGIYKCLKFCLKNFKMWKNKGMSVCKGVICSFIFWYTQIFGQKTEMHSLLLLFFEKSIIFLFSSSCFWKPTSQLILELYIHTRDEKASKAFKVFSICLFLTKRSKFCYKFFLYAWYMTKISQISGKQTSWTSKCFVCQKVYQGV